MPSLRIVMALTLALVSCAPQMNHSSGLRPGHSSTVPVAKNHPQRPVLVKKKNGRYKVAEPWTLELDGKVWNIQKGYSCNGITAPERMKMTLGDGVDKPETWAAVFHDWLFTQPGISRKTADQLFYRALLAYGIPEIKARLMFTSVSAYSATKALR
jgi:hypothetical protein